MNELQFAAKDASLKTRMTIYIRRPCLALAEAGRRLGPPQVWNFPFGNRPKQHRSRPAMPPQCPATPRTAILASESRPASAGPVFVQQWRQVASQAQDSSYVDSESDGWDLGSPRPSWPSLRPAMAPQWPARPRTAWKPSPRLSRPSLRPAMAPLWPAKPKTAVIWIPKTTDGTSGLKGLAAPAQ